MTALPGSGSFAMVDPTHVAAMGPAAAILYARILWRSEASGEWPASRRMLQQETGLSAPMLRTAVQVLRDHEWVTTRRMSPEDATLVWTPVYAGQADIAESATPPLRNPPHPPAESAISSLETGKTLLGETAPEPKAKVRRGRATGYPADFRPKDAHFTLAASLGIDLRIEGPQFRDHHAAKASKFVDWDAALRTWIRNAAKFRGTGNVVPIGDAGLWGTGTEPLLPPPPKRDIFG